MKFCENFDFAETTDNLPDCKDFAFPEICDNVCEHSFDYVSAACF